MTIRIDSRDGHRRYNCNRCGADIEPETYIYSRHTGAHYCGPGGGCNVNKTYERPTVAQQRAAAGIKPEGRLF